MTVWAYRHSFMVLGTLVLLIYFAALTIGRNRQEGFAVLPVGAGAPFGAGATSPAE